MTAGVGRRFGAMLYDLLVVLALFFIVTALFLPFTGGEAITPDRSGGVERIGPNANGTASTTMMATATVRAIRAQNAVSYERASRPFCCN